MLYGDLNRREIQGREDICICVAQSLRCTTETNTTLKSNYTPIKNNIKKRRSLYSPRSETNKILYFNLLFYSWLLEYNFLNYKIYKEIGNCDP